MNLKFGCSTLKRFPLLLHYWRRGYRAAIRTANGGALTDNLREGAPGGADGCGLRARVTRDLGHAPRTADHGRAGQDRSARWCWKHYRTIPRGAGWAAADPACSEHTGARLRATDSQAGAQDITLSYANPKGSVRGTRTLRNTMLC
jgi:hypothetical protein